MQPPGRIEPSNETTYVSIWRRLVFLGHCFPSAIDENTDREEASGNWVSVFSQRVPIADFDKGVSVTLGKSESLSTRSRRSRACIFYINKNQVYFSDSIKCPTSAKRILWVSVPADRRQPNERRGRRPAGTDTVSNVLIFWHLELVKITLNNNNKEKKEDLAAKHRRRENIDFRKNRLQIFKSETRARNTLLAVNIYACNCHAPRCFTCKYTRGKHRARGKGGAEKLVSLRAA